MVEMYVNAIGEEDSANLKGIDYKKIQGKYFKATGAKRAPYTEFLKHQKKLPSTLCNKCRFSPKCPVYLQDSVCFYPTEVLMLTRDEDKFVNGLLDRINQLLWNTTLLGQEQDLIDLIVYLFVVTLLVNYFADKKKQDVDIRHKRGLRTTELGREYMYGTYADKVKAEQKRIKALLKNFNIPLSNVKYPRV